ncbi:porin family protein [Hymenobacter negativus]|uniref:PorT family protein n=1 Tax=Hymenobacter negativus TaxID=2795026 RepID=A0ABS3QLA5_9BACT|nr:porin family protein [Hymenobacter negativus]MBO2012060.1 PorT family protein [Hymenobacter negativus]
MKKSLLSLAIATLAVSGAHAQLHSRSNSFAGFKAGGSAASFVGDGAKNMQYVYGFQAGLFANLALNRPFSIQPELLYSMKGAKTPAGYITQSSIWLNYIDVPVAFRATTKDGLFLEAGPQVSFLINAKSDASGEKVSVKNSYKFVDVGFVLGAGYQPLKGGLGIGGRYNAGFGTALKAATDSRVVTPDLRNSAFQVYLTYSRPTIHKRTKKKE